MSVLDRPGHLGTLGPVDHARVRPGPAGHGPVGFVTGHRLSRALYADVVAPALARHLPGLRWGAGLLGRGSDVLGYDTARSTDHDWGPRLTVVLDGRDLRCADAVLDVVEAALPDLVLRVPVEHRPSRQLPQGPVEHHTTAGRPRAHGVVVTTVSALLREHLGVDRTDELDQQRWLDLPSQALLELTAGPVLRDDTGELTAMRAALAGYPDPVWRVLMARRWRSIGELEPLVGRTAEVGDDLGSRLVAARIGHDAVHLALLQQQRFAPYDKWLGTALARTPGGPEVAAPLEKALGATTADARMEHLLRALVVLAQRHADLGITAEVDPTPVPFFERPWRVLFPERYADTLEATLAG